MSIGFLNNFMQFAYTATNAERGIALDTAMTVHECLSVNDALLADDGFSKLLHKSATEALATNDAIITNNLINPDEAPETNLHVHELRMVVAFPLQDCGVIYLDKRLRRGIFLRDLMDRLIAFANYLIDNDKTDLTSSELSALFEDSPTA